jgi:hypothetical protein
MAHVHVPVQDQYTDIHKYRFDYELETIELYILKHIKTKYYLYQLLLAMLFKDILVVKIGLNMDVN